MESFEKFILKDYNFDCKLRFLLKEYSLTYIITIITSLFNEIDGEKHARTLMVLRDLYIGSDLTDKEKKEYIKTLAKMKTLEYLASFLYAPHYNVRHVTIFTLGKMTQRKYVKYLYNAFDNYYIHRDPLAINACLFEIKWLNRKESSVRIKNLFEQKNSIFAVLSAEHFKKNKNKFVSWLFCRDDFPLRLIKSKNIEAMFEEIKDISFTVELYIKNILASNEVIHYSFEEINSLYRAIINNYEDIEKFFKNAKTQEEKEEKKERIWLDALDSIL